MSSAPEPGRGAAEEHADGGGNALERAAEAPGPESAAEAGPAEPVDGAGEVRHADQVDQTEEPEKAEGPVAAVEEPEERAAVKSDAKPELDAEAAPAPVVRLAKAAAPEPGPVSELGPASEPEPASEPVAEPAAVDRSAGRRRLKAALWPPRMSRGQLVVALLLFSLGLGLAIQVRSTNDHHSQLRGARQEDLVRILDELDSRQQRLQQEKAELEQSLAKLENSSNQAKEAQEQTRKKATELGVLAGTVKATGPGIVLTVDDPQGQVKADMLLDTLQELRAAGAEAIQINDVRVVVNTYFTDVSGGGVQIDGKKVSQPYRFTVVGNPQDLTPALNIPGGVVRTLESHQARATITQQQKVVVDALVDLKTPQYAKPASK
ncbi:DUF881 domain-containing protein [Kitasatospora sp. NPDC059812]|uniref:DUF881 domain-containing protein n=1 Tax=Kitasatospora sp. NPDC059812 TaxID=3346958 RepID=UPI0036488663